MVNKMRNNVLILIIGVIIIIGLAIGIINFMSTNNNQETIEIEENNTTENDNNTTAQDLEQISQEKAEAQENDSGIYYDPELNEYFDENDRTVYDRQFPAGTSKEEIRQALKEIGDNT